MAQCFTMTRHSLSESIVTHIQSHTQPCYTQGPDNHPSLVGEGVYVSGIVWCRCHYKADCTDHLEKCGSIGRQLQLNSPGYSFLGVNTNLLFSAGETSGLANHAPWNSIDSRKAEWSGIHSHRVAVMMTFYSYFFKEQ